MDYQLNIKTKNASTAFTIEFVKSEIISNSMMHNKMPITIHKKVFIGYKINCIVAASFVRQYCSCHI